MNFLKLLNFFLLHIDLKTWVKSFINVIITFLIIISEILFLTTFYIILNKNTDSKFINDFFYELNFFFLQYFDNLNNTELYIIILIFFLFVKNILLIFHHIYYNYVIFDLAVKKSSSLLNSYLNKSFYDFSKKDLSIYIKQIVRDAEGVFVGIFGLIITIFTETLYVIVMIYFISSLIDFSPTLEIYISLFVMVLILYILYVYARKLGNQRSLNEIATFKVLSDTLSVFKEIKIVGNAKSFVDRFGSFLKKYFKTRLTSGIINLSPKFMFEFFLLIIFFIIFKKENAELDISDFVLKYSILALALLRLIPSFAKISSYFSTILYNLRSIEFIKDDLKKDILKPSRNKKKKITNIKLIDVSLNFSKKNKLKNPNKITKLNLDLKINNIYGIYGESGSGKTSILNLISGFIKPSSGRVLINNKKIYFQDITKKFNIGYASQTPTIIDENLIINTTLKYLNSQKTIDEIQIYLKKFNLLKFLKSEYFQDKKISTIKNMSGGEKQRIALIRAFINNPDLILLDEPTSSLDKKNEKLILEYLKNIKKNKIIVVTSHKSEHKKYFDKIINL